MVGPADGPGEESFDVLVCTPRWVERLVQEKGPLIGRHYLIVNQLDIPESVRFLAKQVQSLEAKDWSSLAEKLARIGQWEFEDYQ